LDARRFGLIAFFVGSARTDTGGYIRKLLTMTDNCLFYNVLNDKPGLAFALTGFG
jgi:hypothetical protein